MFRNVIAVLGCMLLMALPSGCAEEEVYNQPQSHIIMGAGDVPLIVQEWGNPEGIPVVLIHGFAFAANAFKFQTGPITRDLRLIAPDLRGHGLSAKPWTPEAYSGTEVWAEDLAAIIEELDLEKPILVGWSFGGYVTMNYIRHYGDESVSGIVLAGSLAGLTERPPPPNPADYGLPPMQGDSRADNFHDLFDNIDWVARAMSYDPPPPALLERKKMNLAMLTPLVRRAMSNLSLDNRDLTDQISTPILFISGEMDGSVPVDYVAAAVEALPSASAVLYEGGVGHSPFEERPERFNQDLLEFAKRHGSHSD